MAEQMSKKEERKEVKDEKVDVVNPSSTVEKSITPKAKSKKATTGRKKVASKTPAKSKTGLKRKPSISSALYALFDKMGVQEVKLDAAVKLAKKIKPDTAFNPKHLAWHKHHYANYVLPRRVALTKAS